MVFIVENSSPYSIKADGTLTRHVGGLCWPIASVFIVADLAGSGIVAIPDAVASTSYWLGLLLLVLTMVMTLTTGILLGKSWNIMLQKYPIYQLQCRKPYSVMGQRIGGTPLKILVTLCIWITNFGASAVFMVLCSKNICDFFRVNLKSNISLCIMICVVSLCILPMTFFKSPEHFTWIVVAGASATVLAMILICAGTLKDLIDSSTAAREFEPLQLNNIWLALGTFLFSYGGHGTFPTIQNDMKRPSDFTKASFLAFGVICILYTIIGALGAWTYRSTLKDSIIDSMGSVQYIQQAVNLLITAHCFLTVSLILNPVNQEVEDFFNVPHEFNWRRILTRSCVVLLLALTGLLLPTFGAILGIIGGSTIMFTSLVFPSIFYLLLSMENKKPRSAISEMPNSDCLIVKHWHRIVSLQNLKSLLICGTIIVFGIIAGGAATYASILEVTKKNMTSCFLKSSWLKAENLM